MDVIRKRYMDVLEASQFRRTHLLSNRFEDIYRNELILMQKKAGLNETGFLYHLAIKTALLVARA